MKFDKKYLLAVVGIVALYAIFLIISDLQIVLDKIQNYFIYCYFILVNCFFKVEDFVTKLQYPYTSKR